MLKWKVFRYKAAAIAWLLIISCLFFLPGSALPQEDWLDKIYFDKWVHIGLFAVLIFLWKSAFNWNDYKYNFILLSLALIYGFAVEFIQLYWIPNRSFDLFDVLADMTGSILGLFVWLRVYKK
jgi:VanZ like family